LSVIININERFETNRDKALNPISDKKSLFGEDPEAEYPVKAGRLSRSEKIVLLIISGQFRKTFLFDTQDQFLVYSRTKKEVLINNSTEFFRTNG